MHCKLTVHGHRPQAPTNERPLPQVTLPGSIGNMRTLRDINVRYNQLTEDYKKKADEGLGRFLEFLRAEELRLALAEVERLRPKPVQIGAYMEYRVKSDGKSGGEGAPVPEANAERTVCLARTGTTPVLGAEALWIFGGTLVSGRKTNDLYIMYIQRLAWESPPPAGDVPPPRDNHACWFDEVEKRFFVFGGRGDNRRRCNDLRFLDATTKVWKQVNASNAPSPRDRMSCCVVDRMAVIFGGKGPKVRHNDVHYFDMDSGQWSQATVSGSVPPPREASAMTGHDGKVLLFGGRNTFCLNDLYVLHIATAVWTVVSTAKPLPPLYGCDMHLTEHGQLLLWGGYTEQHHTNHSFLRINTKALLGAGAPPPPPPAAVAAKEDAAEEEGDAPAAEPETDEPPPEHEEEPAAEGEEPAPAAAAEGEDGLTLDWVAVDSELGENDSRGYAWMGGINKDGVQEDAIGVLQAPPDMRKGGEGVAEPAWDIYRHARVADLRVQATQAAEGGDDALSSHAGATNPKLGRCLAVEARRDKAAPSFRANSSREAAALQYADDFRITFSQIHPQRRPLLLERPNECGVPKLVVSTVRPTKLPYSMLYDWHGVARFVSEFVSYEPLDNALAYPSRLPSPSTVLDWQAGDSFDLAILEASLLLGVGYDAYVVVGYALRSITQNDQSCLVCPWLEPVEQQGKDAAVAAGARAKPVASGQNAKPKYLIKKPVKLESQFLTLASNAEQRAIEEAQAAEAASIAAAAAAEAEAQAAAERQNADDLSDTLKGRRLHAWVLVRSGKRDVGESFFLEPGMGRRYPLTECPYFGVEAVWNNLNYWVNIQRGCTGDPYGSVQALPPTVSFDLGDAAKWEALFGEDAPAVDSEGEDDGYVRYAHESDPTALSYHRAPAPKPPPAPESVGGGDATSRDAASIAGQQSAPSTVGAPGITPGLSQQKERATTAGSTGSGDGAASGRKRSATRAASAKRGGADVAGGDEENELEALTVEAAGVVAVPHSWVPRLQLTQRQFDMRCPRGAKARAPSETQQDATTPSPQENDWTAGCARR